MSTDSLSPAHYSVAELNEMLGAVGDDVRIDRSVRFFGGRTVRIGSRVRIDCFGLISAGPDGVEIGDNVHIAAGCYLFGGGGQITLGDFSNLSSRVAIYTASDDYTEGYLTNPTVPEMYKKVKRDKVVIGRHVIVGAGSVILPGVTLGFGAAIGALTVVRKSVADCLVGSGNPMALLPKTRNGDRLRSLEAAFRSGRADAGGE